MPTYEYQCLKCKKHFEQLQKMSDAPLKKCARCGGKVERQIGAGSGLIFKGSGFYITDYKKKKEGGPPSAEGKPESKKEKKNDAPQAKK